jgi:hypothetical protein
LYEIHEFGSATANCEMLCRITIDAKKKKAGIRRYYCITLYLLSVLYKEPPPSPTHPTKLNTNNHPPLLLCENSFRLRGKHGSP